MPAFLAPLTGVAVFLAVASTATLLLAGTTAFALACVANALLIVMAFHFFEKPGLNEPPKVSGWIPYIGCGLEYSRNPHRTVRKYRDILGETFTLHMFGVNRTFLLDPADVAVFNRTLSRSRYSPADAVAAVSWTSLLPQRSDETGFFDRRHGQSSEPAALEAGHPDHIKSLVPDMQTVIEDKGPGSLGALPDCADAAGPGRIHDLFAFSRELMLAVTLRAVVGPDAAVVGPEQRSGANATNREQGGGKLERGVWMNAFRQCGDPDADAQEVFSSSAMLRSAGRWMMMMMPVCLTRQMDGLGERRCFEAVYELLTPLIHEHACRIVQEDEDEEAAAAAAAAAAVNASEEKEEENEEFQHEQRQKQARPQPHEGLATIVRWWIRKIKDDEPAFSTAEAAGVVHRKRICRDVLELVLADVANSSAAVSWTILHILQDSSVRQQIDAELNFVFGVTRGGVAPTTTAAAAAVKVAASGNGGGGGRKSGGGSDRSGGGARHKREEEEEEEELLPNNGWVTMQQLEACSYLRSVILEVGRLYANVGQMKLAHQPYETEMTGLRVPAGNVLVISAHENGRHPAFFSRPDTFDPDRHNDEGSAAALASGMFAPFAAGSGNFGQPGLGRRFAVVQVTLAVVLILRRLDLTLAMPPGMSAHPNPKQVARMWRPDHAVPLEYTTRRLAQRPESAEL